MMHGRKNIKYTRVINLYSALDLLKCVPQFLSVSSPLQITICVIVRKSSLQWTRRLGLSEAGLFLLVIYRTYIFKTNCPIGLKNKFCFAEWRAVVNEVMSLGVP